jgi:hypothetical protein
MILHLFKKVYLAFDSEIDLNRQRLIFSEIHGNDISKDLNDFFFGKLHLFSHDIDDLIGQDKQFSDYIDFFDFLNKVQNENDTRIFIYCDVNSYRKIICNWFKIIFESIDVDSAYKILEFNFLKRKLLATRNTSIKTLSFTSNMFEEMLETKNNFNSYFDSINLNQQKTISFYNNIKEYLSIEYLLASYLYNGQNKNIFKNVLEKMINRMLEDAMKEIVLILFDIVMLKKIQQKMRIKEYNSKNILEIFEDEKFKDLIETNTWRFLDENNNFERVDFKKISIEKKHKIRESYKLILNSVYNEISSQENYEHNRIDYMYYLNLDGISDENLNKIIENECLFEMETTLWSNQDQESVNLFFAQYVMENYSENNIENLNPYLLRN